VGEGQIGAVVTWMSATQRPAVRPERPNQLAAIFRQASMPWYAIGPHSRRRGVRVKELDEGINVLAEDAVDRRQLAR